MRHTTRAVTPVIWTLLTLSVAVLFAPASHAEISAAEAAAAAYCECNYQGAFPNAINLFNPEQIREMKYALTHLDPRRPIDRRSDRFKYFNDVGQVVIDGATGSSQ